MNRTTSPLSIVPFFHRCVFHRDFFSAMPRSSWHELNEHNNFYFFDFSDSNYTNSRNAARQFNQTNKRKKDIRSGPSCCNSIFGYCIFIVRFCVSFIIIMLSVALSHICRVRLCVYAIQKPYDNNNNCRHRQFIKMK